MSLFDTKVLVEVGARELVPGDVIYAQRGRRSVVSVKLQGAWVALRTQSTGSQHEWPKGEMVRSSRTFVVDRVEPEPCA